MHRLLLGSLLFVLTFVAVACREDRAATPTTVPASPTATPAPLLTQDEAEKKADQFAAGDQDVSDDVVDAILSEGGRVIISCFSAENRYSQEHQTWVIHCRFLDASSVRPSLTATAAGRPTALSLSTLYEKVYLVDDASGAVRY